MHGAARDLETETRAPSLTGEDPSEPPPPSFADYLRHASLLGLPSRTTGDTRDPSEPSNLGTVSAALSPDRPRGSHPSLVASPAGLAAQARPSPEIASPPRSKQRRVSFGGLASGPTPSAPPSAPISAEAPTRTNEPHANFANRARRVSLAIDACESDALLTRETGWRATREAGTSKGSRHLVLGLSSLALTLLAIAMASLLQWNDLKLALFALSCSVAASITLTLVQRDPADHPRAPRATAPPSPPPSPEERPSSGSHAGRLSDPPRHAPSQKRAPSAQPQAASKRQRRRHPWRQHSPSSETTYPRTRWRSFRLEATRSNT